MPPTPSDVLETALRDADRAGLTPPQLRRRVRTAFRSLARLTDPTLTLEIGAFEAGFSRWVTRELPNARAVAFEANPLVWAHHRDEVTALGVEYLNLAIGPENGPVTLNVPRDFDGRARDPVNRMASLGSNLRSEEQVTVEVPGVRLDDAVPLAADDRLVAWIDVEGALGAVLPASAATLGRAAAVYVEVEAEPMWDGQWLDRDVLAWFEGIDLVPVLRDRQRREQYNVLLVPRPAASTPEVTQVVRRALRPAPPG
ncbi:FkbM family methyltransferase [Nocardioides dilutus]